MIDAPIADIERFARQFEIQEDGCWQFKCLMDKGYGQFGYKGGVVRAHRWLYKVVNQVDLNRIQVCDHLCRNRECVNPKHIEIVSHRTNLLRGKTFAASNAAKTHCKRGHEYTPENTYIKSKNWRSCKECSRTYKRRKAMS